LIELQIGEVETDDQAGVEHGENVKYEDDKQVLGYERYHNVSRWNDFGYEQEEHN